MANDLPDAISPDLLDEATRNALDPATRPAPEGLTLPSAPPLSPSAPPPSTPFGRITREPRTQEERLLSLEPGFRAHAASIVAELRAAGYDPIYASAWRSISTQRQLHKEGKTKVLFSFHNATAPDGSAAALAADIVDRKLLWSLTDANAAFFHALGAAAYKRGLHWGGGAASGFSMSAPWKKYKLAWDPGHIQALPNRELGRVRAASGGGR